VRQVNAVPNRPAQSLKEGTFILGTLPWTILPDGETQKRKRWNIPNSRDAHGRAFASNQLISRHWHNNAPGIQRWTTRSELCSCAKGNHSDETQEHIHRPLEECFGAKFRPLQPTQQNMDTASLRPWNSQGWLHPSTLRCTLAEQEQQQQQLSSSNSSVARSRRGGATPCGYHGASGPPHRSQGDCTKVQSSAAYHLQPTIARMLLHPHPIYPQVHRLDGGPEGGGPPLSIPADARH